MLYYNRITFPKGIDVNNTSAFKKYICIFVLFLDKGFRFQTTVCKSCHKVLMMSIGINNIVILDIYSVDYWCIIFGVSRNQAIYILYTSKNSNLSEKKLIIKRYKKS